jgi:hypothetical protein
LKLHGSIDWWKRDDGKIVTSGSNESLYGERLIEHLMIYPVYEKYISLEPFYSLYIAFRKILFEEEVIIIIGYSFRDVSINNAFLDHLRNNLKARLIITCKLHSVEVRIKNIFKGFSTRISIIEKYFGEESFISDLTTRLRSPG